MILRALRRAGVHLGQPAVALLAGLGEAVAADRAALQLVGQVVEAVVEALVERVGELLHRARRPQGRVLPSAIINSGSGREYQVGFNNILLTPVVSNLNTNTLRDEPAALHL